MAKTGSDPVDYTSIELPDPDEVPYPEWDVDERRAALLRACLQAGGPARINQSRFADRFDVHRSAITRDKKAIGEHVARALRESDESLALEIKSAFNRIYNDLMDAGEPEKAWRVVREWADLVLDVGYVERSPTRHEVTTREASAESDSYVLVPDDAEVDVDGAAVVTAEDLEWEEAPEGSDDVRPGAEFKVNEDLG